MVEKNRRQLPPYVSYRSFWNFLERLHEAIPARIDRSYWGDKFSGSTGTQLMSALRYLNLIDDEGIPTELLRSLVASREFQRDELMAQIARNGYSFFLSGTVDYRTATYAQFEDILHSTFQVNSDVARKCIKFFIDLATDARIPLSPFVVKKNRKSRAGSAGKRTKNRTEKKQENGLVHSAKIVPDGTTVDKLLIHKFPEFDPSWPDEIKLKWFSAFDELIKRIPGPPA
ncbi:MAG: DUF5343 domain-containing protein [Dehalococcoidaceae bacterium]|nr:DUF5343 domain-containing protein [Dehalococcoidaceae bacterium]